MKTYVVGYISFYENELYLEQVSAENELDAILRHSSLSGHDYYKHVTTVQELQEEFFNGDSMVNVIEVKSK